MRAAHLVRLEEAADLPTRLVGAKARNLGRLRREGLPVPPAFVLTTEAWRAFAGAAGLGPLLAEAARPDPADADALAAQIARRCREAPLPEAVRSAADRALADLPGRVAVRSSAPAEDGREASAAGQFATVLDRSGPDDVLEAVRTCWASLASPAALAYRRDRGVAAEAPPAMAVVIQALVDPDCAGVLFSGEPTLLEAVAGSGAALVDGRANPIRCALDPAGAPLGGEVPAELGALLGREDLAALAACARRAEAVLGGRVDLEWARARGEVHVLQARPITRDARAGGAGRVRWTAANTQEALLDPVTPLTWSLFAPLVEKGRRDLFQWAGFAEIPGPGYMRLFFGLPYFNPDYFRAFLAQIPGVSTNVFDALIFGEGEEGLRFELPRFTPRTIRLLLLYVLGRLAARERFEVFQRLFTVRLAAIDRRDLTGLSDEALVARRRRATQLLEAALRRHVLGTAISGAGYLLLDMLLRGAEADRAFGGGLVARLTAGAPGNAVALSSARLEGLAREAARRPALVEALEETPSGRWEELVRLGAEGRWFVDRLRAFLERHGHRAEKEAELAEPRWADDPAVLVAILRSFVRAARGGGGAALRRLRPHEAGLARDAAGLADRVSAWLGRWSRLERLVPLRRLAFRALLREARRYAPYRENLKDQALRALHLVRRTFLEAGERLVRRGLIARPDDVFFLELEEVEAALLRPEAEPTVDHRALVARRRAERAEHLGRRPPRYVIEVPGEAPRPIHVGGRIGRLLEGVGVSGGVLRGRARVLASMDDADRVEAGDVIVSRVVNAGWTPLFHLAGAIVTEVGGVLSHAAIVAREYGLPAVFGVEGATQVPDGAWVEVDGERGIVTIEAEPSE